MLLHLLLSLYIPWFRLVYCRHNVTVDDQNPLITYNPRQSWSLSANSSLDAGWAHMLTQDVAATAEINFTGVAVYFMSPLWPYVVNTAVALDSGPFVHLDLTDHSLPNMGQGSETVQSQVVWSATGLTNTLHTLVISVIPDQAYAIVDTIIYTALDAEDLTTVISTSGFSTSVINSLSVESSSSSTTSIATATASALSSRRVLPIALGAALGTFILLLAGLGLCLCRWKKRPASEAWSISGASQLEIAGPENNSNTGNAQDFPVGTAREATAASSYQDVIPSVEQEKDTWQGTTAQIAQRYRSPSYYQPSTYS